MDTQGEPSTHKSYGTAGPSSRGDRSKQYDYNDMFNNPNSVKATRSNMQYELMIQNTYSKLKSEENLMKHKYF